MSCYCIKDRPEQPKACKDISFDKIYKSSTVTKADFEWICEKRNDKKFSAELSKFGNFLHGTHVAHIAARRSPKSKIMGLKLIPTEMGEATSWMMDVFKSSYKAKRTYATSNDDKKKNEFREKLLKTLLGQLAKAQTTVLDDVFTYIGDQGVSVVNGSFGTPFEAIKMFSDNAFRVIFFRKPTKEESDKYATVYFNAQLKLLSTPIAEAKDTLFVFAAGNSSSDNDVFPTSPTNINLPNVISVAASFEYDSLASFSNYGSKTVDLAAPGVVIKAAIPSEAHDEFIEVSGTSQASPFVAGVAANMRAINPRLTPAEVKKILLETVDQRDFLEGKVGSNGSINEKRANEAAELTNKMKISEAISKAKKSIEKIKSKKVDQSKDQLASYMPDLSHDPSTREEMERIINSMATQMSNRLR